MGSLGVRLARLERLVPPGHPDAPTIAEYAAAVERLRAYVAARVAWARGGRLGPAPAKDADPEDAIGRRHRAHGHAADPGARERLGVRLGSMAGQGRL